MLTLLLDKQSVSSPLKKKSKKEKGGISSNAKSGRFRADSEPAAAGTVGTTLKLKKGSGSTYVANLELSWLALLPGEALSDPSYQQYLIRRTNNPVS